MKRWCLDWRAYLGFLASSRKSDRKYGKKALKEYVLPVLHDMCDISDRDRPKFDGYISDDYYSPIWKARKYVMYIESGEYEKAGKYARDWFHQILKEKDFLVQRIK